MDFVDGSVAVDVQFDAGKGGGEFLAQAAGDFAFKLFLRGGGDIIERGNAGLDDIAAAVARADTHGKRGTDIEQSVVFGVAGGAGGGAGRMAGVFQVDAFGLEFGINFVEDLLEFVFPAFDACAGCGHEGGPCRGVTRRR